MPETTPPPEPTPTEPEPTEPTPTEPEPESLALPTREEKQANYAADLERLAAEHNEEGAG